MEVDFFLFLPSPWIVFNCSCCPLVNVGFLMVRFSNKLHLFCPVKYQFPDCFMTADAAHNSDCNLHLCFIQPDDVENAGGYRAWNMVCSWNDSGCWLNFTDE